MSSIRHVVIALICVLSVSISWAFADSLHISPDDRQAVSQTSSFITKYKIDSIPPAVQAAFSKEVHDVKFSMADPGEKWQATDAITESGLPRRRLIFVSLSKTHCLVHYERGGIGHSFHIVLFRLERSRARLVWRAAVNSKLKGMTEVSTAIQKGIIDDNPNNYF
jgi:hypothetical protein